MRRRIALALAFVGGILTLSTAAVYGLGLSNATYPTTVAGDRSIAKDPIARPLAMPEPVNTVRSPSAVSGSAPVYDLSTDPASINYPAWLVGAELDNAKLGTEQNFIIARCMDDQGFNYTWQTYWDREQYGESNQLDDFEEAPGYARALYGDADTGVNYNWHDAGCHGYAVQVTGQDNAH